MLSGLPSELLVLINKINIAYFHTAFILNCILQRKVKKWSHRRYKWAFIFLSHKIKMALMFNDLFITDLQNSRIQTFNQMSSIRLKGGHCI